MRVRARRIAGKIARASTVAPISRGHALNVAARADQYRHLTFAPAAAAPATEKQFERACERPAAIRADLPSDRRPARQHLPGARDGARGRLHLRHVRHRRRIPDDAAADLHRRAAGRGGGERHRPMSRPRRSPARSPIGGATRSIRHAGADAACRRHRRHASAASGCSPGCARSTSSISSSACPTSRC